MTLAGFLLVLLTAACMAVANVLMKNGIAHAGGFSPSVSALFSLLRQTGLRRRISSLRHRRPHVVPRPRHPKALHLLPALRQPDMRSSPSARCISLHEKSAQKLLGLLIIIVGITTVARG